MLKLSNKKYVGIFYQAEMSLELEKLGEEVERLGSNLHEKERQLDESRHDMQLVKVSSYHCTTGEKVFVILWSTGQVPSACVRDCDAFELLKGVARTKLAILMKTLRT